MENQLPYTIINQIDVIHIIGWFESRSRAKVLVKHVDETYLHLEIPDIGVLVFMILIDPRTGKSRLHLVNTQLTNKYHCYTRRVVWYKDEWTTTKDFDDDVIIDDFCAQIAEDYPHFLTGVK